MRRFWEVFCGREPDHGHVVFMTIGSGLICGLVVLVILFAPW